MDHETEIPGAPTRILAVEEGDAVDLPHEVDTDLRRGRRETLQERRERVLPMFRVDYELSENRSACLHDWGTLHPDLLEDYRAVIEDMAPPTEKGSLRLVHSGEPVSPRPSRPILPAFMVSVFALILIECVLIALRVGHAIDWDWGWVLAPLLLPSLIATIVIGLTGIALAAMDERDAARRRGA